MPFTLLNTAFFMAPRTAHPSNDPAAEGRVWWSVRVVSEAVQRELALAMTLILVAAATWLSMDVVGWQCGSASSSCSATKWTGFLGWNWLEQPPGRRLAVTALLPLLLVVLLWLLGRWTWARAERIAVPMTADTRANAGDGDVRPDRSTWVSPLEDRRIWNGEVPVARLRALHVAASLAVVGLLLTAPFLSAPNAGPAQLLEPEEWNRAWGWLPATLMTAFLVILAICAIALCWKPLFNREMPRWVKEDSADDAGARATEARSRSGLSSIRRSAIVWITAGMLAVAFIMAWFARTAPGSPSTADRKGNLPWLAGTTFVLIAAQWALVVLVFFLCLAQAWSSTNDQRRARERNRDGGVDSTRAVYGMAQPLFAAMACVLLQWITVAFILRVADFFGDLNPVRHGASPRPNAIVLPIGFYWTAVAALAMAVLAVVVIGALYVASWIQRSSYVGRVIDAYFPELDAEAEPDAAAAAKAQAEAGTGGHGRAEIQNRLEDEDRADEDRTKAIARAWGSASLTDVVIGSLGLIAFAFIVLLSVIFMFYILDADWLAGQKALVAAGNLVMTLTVALLLLAGHRAYSQPQFRRIIGNLWDIGTFWPRATHPLAPPCYAERTVPDLLARTEAIRRNGGHIILSGHSQGSVISAVTVFQSSFAGIEATALLTYGSPLRRLYARFFPGYFGPEMLERLGDLLGDPNRTAGEQHESAEPPWRWINLHRSSDSIGGAVFVNRRPPTTAWPSHDERAPGLPRGDHYKYVDWHRLDPGDYAHAAGDPCDARILGHSDYQRDPGFRGAVRILAGRIPTKVAVAG